MAPHSRAPGVEHGGDADPGAKTRIAEAMSLMEHEWARGEGRERRLHVVISDTMSRTYR